MELEIATYIKENLSRSETEIQSDTLLITSGIIDSISTLKLVEHLESTYNVEFDAHEVDAEHLDSIDKIIALIKKKKEA